MIAPPTGYAEEFIDLWLRSSQDGPQVDALRTMAPSIDLPRPASGAQATVERVVAVRSSPMGSRTWQVTVAATLLLPTSSAQSGSSAQSSAQSGIAQPTGVAQSPSPAQSGVAQSSVPTVRYFAVPVSMVRSSGSGGAPDALVISAAPAQVAAPAALSGDPAATVYGSVINGGPLQQTVAGYLTAYLTGIGDSTRYLSPGARVPAPAASYSKVELSTLGANGPVPATPVDGTVLEVQAQVLATDSAGTWPLSYPLRLRARAGRWEVAALAPVPSSPSSSSSSSGSGVSPSPVPSMTTTAGVN
ncbi:conjugal transfer protein [Kitasatospora sp. RB6PN24]|uniref:conjugal transfer protein n=1 Tax=Kitasatospora humi TaxID=2893891 RepID=UPI001E5F7C0B|nr:conjugal transfer protein [Kitasatospora humi]MCC9309944.1 conjugal transfer protein [Kitasatospora humi]